MDENICSCACHKDDSIPESERPYCSDCCESLNAAVRDENAALRKRVEELEKALRGAMAGLKILDRNRGPMAEGVDMILAEGEAALSHPSPAASKPCPTCKDGGGCADCGKEKPAQEGRS